MKRLFAALLLNLCTLSVCFARPDYPDVYGDGYHKPMSGISEFIFIAFLILAFMYSNGFRIAIKNMALFFVVAGIGALVFLFLFELIKPMIGKIPSIICVTAVSYYLLNKIKPNL